MSRLLAMVASALFAVCVLAGCRPDLSRETAAVESMFPVLDNIDARLAQLDTIAPMELAERLRFQCGRVQPDSLFPSVLTDRLSEVCTLPEMVTDILTRKHQLATETKVTRQQLRDLHTDLSRGIANKDSVSAFIETEFLYVEHLSELSDELEDALNACIQLDLEFQPTMDSLMTVTTAKFVE